MEIFFESDMLWHIISGGPMRMLIGFLLGGCFALFTATSFADSSFGTELSVLPNAAYKNLTYAYDSDWGWGLTVETNPKYSSSSLGASGMHWSAFDIKTNTYLFGWKQFSQKSPVFSINLNSPAEMIPLLKAQKNVVIVVALADGTPQFFIDLGKFCSLYPNSVKNLSDTTAKACEVGQFSEPTLACKALGDRLEDWVKKKLLTCDSAEKTYLTGSHNFPDAVNCSYRKFCQ